MIRARVNGIILIVLVTLFLFSGSAFAQIYQPKQKGIVVIDLANKQNIRGNGSRAYAWGEQLSPPRQYLRSLINLKEAMVRWTDIKTTMEDHLRLSSTKLLRMPFIYVMTDEAFELTETEKKNVRQYLLNGGFMVLDNATPLFEYGQAEASLRQMLRDVLGSRARFVPIPNNHEIYHCFFDFDDGPPLGAEIGRVPLGTHAGGKGGTTMNKIAKQVFYLEGIWIDERLVAVYSDKGYAVRWSEITGNYPQLKMGVNMVVFALTQPGGIAVIE